MRAARVHTFCKTFHKILRKRESLEKREIVHRMYVEGRRDDAVASTIDDFAAVLESWTARVDTNDTGALQLQGLYGFDDIVDARAQMCQIMETATTHMYRVACDVRATVCKMLHARCTEMCLEGHCKDKVGISVSAKEIIEMIVQIQRNVFDVLRELFEMAPYDLNNYRHALILCRMLVYGRHKRHLPHEYDDDVELVEKIETVGDCGTVR